MAFAGAFRILALAAPALGPIVAGVLSNALSAAAPRNAHCQEVGQGSHRRLDVTPSQTKTPSTPPVTNDDITPSQTITPLRAANDADFLPVD